MFQFSILPLSKSLENDSTHFQIRDYKSSIVYTSPKITGSDGTDTKIVNGEVFLGNADDFQFLLCDTSQNEIIEDFTSRIIQSTNDNVLLLLDKIQFRYKWNNKVTSSEIISKFRENVKRRKEVQNNITTDTDQIGDGIIESISTSSTFEVKNEEEQPKSQLKASTLNMDTFENFDSIIDDFEDKVKFPSSSNNQDVDTHSMDQLIHPIQSDMFAESNGHLRLRTSNQSEHIGFSRTSKLSSSTRIVGDSSSLQSSSVNRNEAIIQKLESQIQEHMKEIQNLKNSNMELSESIDTMKSNHEIEISTLRTKHAHEIKSLHDEIQQVNKDKLQLQSQFDKLLDEERISQGQKFGKMIHKSKKEQDKLVNEIQVLQEKCALQENLLKENETLLKERDADLREHIERNNSLNVTIQLLRRDLELKEKERQSELEVKDISISNIEAQFMKQKEELNDKIFQLESKLEQVSKENEMNIEKLKVLRQENASLQSRASDLEKQLKTEDMNLSNTYKRLTNLQKENEELQSNKKLIESELAFTKDSLEQVNGEHKNEIKSSLREIQLLKDRLEQMKNIYNQNMNEQKEKLNVRINELVTENESLNKKFQEIGMKFDKEYKKNLRLDESKQELKSQNIDLTNQINELKASLNQRIKLYQELQDTNSTLEKELQGIQMNFKSIEDNLKKANEESKKELSSYKSQVQNLQIENETLSSMNEKAKSDYLKMKLLDEDRQKQLLIQHERIRLLERDAIQLADEKEEKERLVIQVTSLQRENLEYVSTIENREAVISNQNEKIQTLENTLHDLETQMISANEESRVLQQTVDEVKLKFTSEKNMILSKHKKLLSQIQQELEKTQADQAQWMNNLQAPISKIMKTLGIVQNVRSKNERERTTDQTLTNALNTNTTILIHEPKFSQVHSLNESDISHNEEGSMSEFIEENLANIVKRTHELKAENEKLQSLITEQEALLEQKNSQLKEYETDLEELRRNHSNKLKEETQQLYSQIENFQHQVLGHKRVIEEYEETVKSLEREVESQKDILESEKRKLNLELSNKDSLLHDEKERRFALEKELESQRKSMIDIERNIALVRNEYDKILEEKNAILQEKNDLIMEIDQHTVQFKVLEERLSDDISTQKEQYETQITTLVRDFEFLKEEKRSTEDALTYSESQRKKAIELKDLADSTVVELKSQLDILQNSLKNSLQDINTLQQSNQILEGERNSLELQVKSMENEIVIFKETLETTINSHEEYKLNSETENERLTSKNKQLNDRKHSLEAELQQTRNLLQENEQYRNEEQENHQRLMKQLENEMQNKISLLETQLSQSKHQIIVLEKEYWDVKKRADTLNDDFIEEKHKFEEEKRKSTQLEEDIAIANEKVKELSEQVQEFMYTTKNLNETIESMTSQLDTLRSNHTDSMEKYEELSKILDQTRENHNQSEKALIQNYQSRIESLNSEHSKIVKTMESNFTSRISVLTNELTKLKSMHKELSEEFENSQQRESLLKEQLQELKSNQEFTEESYNATVVALQEKEKMFTLLQIKYNQTENELQTLKSDLNEKLQKQDEEILTLNGEVYHLQSKLQEKNLEYDNLEKLHIATRGEVEESLQSLQKELQSQKDDYNLQVEINDAKAMELEQLKQDIDSLQNTIREANDIRINLENKISSLELLLEEKQNQLEDMGLRIQEVTARRDSVIKDLQANTETLNTTHKQEVTNLNAKISEFQERLQDKQIEIESLKENMSAAEQKYDQVMNELSQTQSLLKQTKVHLEANYDTLQTEYDSFKEETHQLIEAKKEEITALTNAVSTLRKSFDKSQEEKLEEIESLQERIVELNKNYSQCEYELEEQRNRLLEAQSLHDALLDETKSREIHLTQEIESANTRIQDYRNQIEEMDRKVSEKELLIQSLQQEIKEFEKEIRARTKESEREIAHLKEEIKIKEDTVLTLEKDNSRLKDLCDTNEQKIKRLSLTELKYNETIEAYEKEQLEHHATKTEVHNLEVKLDELVQEYNHYKLVQSQTIEKLQNQLMEMNVIQEKNTQLKKEKLDIESQLQKLDEDLSAKIGEVQFFEEQLKEYENIKREHIAISSEKESILQENNSLKLKIDQLSIEKEELVRQLDQELLKSKDIKEQKRAIQKEMQRAEKYKDQVASLKKKVKALKKTSMEAVRRLKDHFEAQIQDMEQEDNKSHATRNDYNRIQLEYEYLKQNFLQNISILQQENHQLTCLLAERDHELQLLMEEKSHYNERIDELKHASKLAKDMYKEKLQSIKELTKERLEEQKIMYENRIKHLQKLQAPIYSPNNTSTVSSRLPIHEIEVYEKRIHSLKAELQTKEKELQQATSRSSQDLERVTKKYDLRINALKLQLLELQQRETNGLVNVSIGNKISHLEEVCRIEKSRATLLKAENQRLKAEIVNLKVLHEEWLKEKNQLKDMIESLEDVNTKLGHHYRKMLEQPQKTNEHLIELRTLLQVQEKRALEAEKLSKQQMKKCEALQRRLDKQIRFYDEKENETLNNANFEAKTSKGNVT